MSRPALNVMQIAAADPALFEHLMARAGLRIVPRDNDPLSTTVQAECVEAVASCISEGAGDRVKLPAHQRRMKTLAERLGYVVMVESPDWHRHEEYEALQKDARDDAMSDPEFGADSDEGLHGEMPMGETGGMPTGQALFDQLMADIGTNGVGGAPEVPGGPGGPMGMGMEDEMEPFDHNSDQPPY